MKPVEIKTNIAGTRMLIRKDEGWQCLKRLGSANGETQYEEVMVVETDLEATHWLNGKET